MIIVHVLYLSDPIHFTLYKWVEKAAWLQYFAGLAHLRNSVCTLYLQVSENQLFLMLT